MRLRLFFRGIALAVALAIGLPACGVGPQPDPPSLDPGTVSLRSDGMTVEVTGEMSEGARAVAFNLEITGMGAIEQTVTDGAYAIPGIPLAAPNDMIRVQVFDGDRASEPLDFRADMTPIADRLECLRRDVGPVYDLDPVVPGDVAAARIPFTNECGTDVFIEMPRMAVGAQFQILGGAGPGLFYVPAGETRHLLVTFLAPEGAPSESLDVIVLDSSSTGSRIAITVRGRSE
jgi:hypothetical protein